MASIRVSVLLWLLGALLMPACATSERVIPEPLEAEVDQSVTFDEVRESPDQYQGRMVVFGGEVLRAKRLKDGTQMEILQLPLYDLQPVPERGESKGRFLALEREFLDPATMEAQTRVTVVGVVTGATTQRLGEAEYRYPTLEIKHLKVWKDTPYAQRGYSRPWFGISGGAGTGGYGGVGVGIGF